MGVFASATGQGAADATLPTVANSEHVRRMSVHDLPKRVCEKPTSIRACARCARQLYESRDLRRALEEIDNGLALSAQPEDSDAVTLLKRLKTAILERHFDELVGPLRPLVSPKRPPRFEKGCLVEVLLILRLNTLEAFAKVIRTSALDRVHLLSAIIDDIGDTGLRALRGANLPGVRELDIWVRGPLSPGGVEDLVRAPLAKRCEALSFRADRLVDSNIEPLLTGSPLLEELRLRSEITTGITPMTAMRIADSRYLTQLTSLELNGTSIGDEGALALATSETLRGLRTLSLRNGFLTNEGARILAASPTLKHLEHLDVSRNTIDEAGLLELRHMDIAVNTDNQHPAQ